MQLYVSIVSNIAITSTLSILNTNKQCAPIESINSHSWDYLPGIIDFLWIQFQCMERISNNSARIRGYTERSSGQWLAIWWNSQESIDVDLIIQIANARLALQTTRNISHIWLKFNIISIEIKSLSIRTEAIWFRFNQFSMIYWNMCNTKICRTYLLSILLDTHCLNVLITSMSSCNNKWKFEIYSRIHFNKY